MRFLLILVAAAGIANAVPRGPKDECKVPGQYTCKDKTEIWVCNSSKFLVLSSKCNSGCCTASSGVAHCKC